MNTETLEKANKLQKEMHEVVTWMMSQNNHLKYQDCVTVYMLVKISEITESLEGLGFGLGYIGGK